MKLPSKTLEKKLFQRGYGYICAVDEVGMGSLAGPVVVCAVGFTKHFYEKTHRNLRRIRDSKLLQPQQREIFAKELMKEKDLVYAISRCSPKIIDRINIYHAARLAMRRAVARASEKVIYRDFSQGAGIVLVDGGTKINGLGTDQIPIIKGDRKIFAIACASIIAKVYRDKIMVHYAQKYPGYGFEKHKGYGTEYHKTQLASLGLCEIHRKSFAPAAKLI